MERASGVVDVPLQPYLIFDSRLAGTSQYGVLWKGGSYQEESDWKPVFGQVASNEPEVDQADEPGVLPQVPIIFPTVPRLVPGEDPADCRPSDTELNSLVINAGEVVDSDGVDSDIPGDGKLEYKIQRIYPEIDVEVFYFNDTVTAANNCDREGPEILPGFGNGSYHQLVDATLEWAVEATDPLATAGVEPGGVWRVVVVWDDGSEVAPGGRCGAAGVGAAGRRSTSRRTPAASSGAARRSRGARG